MPVRDGTGMLCAQADGIGGGLEVVNVRDPALFHNHVMTWVQQFAVPMATQSLCMVY